MNGENQPRVTNALVEFENEPVEVQDFKKITKKIKRNLLTICQHDKLKKKYHAMKPFGLGNTRI